MKQKSGLFITFEGIDGCGKSTQIRLLKEYMEEQSRPCLCTAEPSTGPIGSLLREYLSGQTKADERTLAALFAADRLDHLLKKEDGILENVRNGIHVLCDRYYLSNYAYQGITAPIDWIMQLNREAAETLRPDCHIFLDTSPEISMQRICAGRSGREIYETGELLTKIRKQYLALIRELEGQETVFVIDGSRPPQQVAEEIRKKLTPLLE